MIYFAQLPTGGIKIGFSTDVDGRIHALEQQYQEPLSLPHVMEGDLETERNPHLRFAHLRFQGTEQFKPGPDLMEFLGLPVLVSANPDIVTPVGPIAKQTRAWPGDYEQVKITADVVKSARIVCAYRGEGLATYMSGLLAPLVARDLADEQRKAAGPQRKGAKP